MPRTLVEVDRTQDMPLYRQVRLAIEHGIATGTFDVLHRLPSSRELAISLAVSRNTINLAYQELVAEGLVLSHERRGLFVNPEMREACAAQSRSTASRVDWAARVRHYPDADLPHSQKQTDWHRFPYPFLAGQCDVNAFPARAWVRCLRDSLYQPHVYASLQDSEASDDPMLGHPQAHATRRMVVLLPRQLTIGRLTHHLPLVLELGAVPPQRPVVLATVDQQCQRALQMARRVPQHVTSSYPTGASRPPPAGAGLGGADPAGQTSRSVDRAWRHLLPR